MTDQPQPEPTLLTEALRDAANAWTQRIRSASNHPDNTTCGVCPVCLTVSHVGQSHPEMLRALAEVVAALSSAAMAATDHYQATHPRSAQPGEENTADDAQTEPPRPGSGRRTVQRITLTD